MPRPFRRALLLAGLSCVASPRAGAEPPAEAPPAATADGAAYGDTYTAEELAALDRALHAVGCNRVDLTFRKDMAKGLGCLPVVREMLRDPLRIAAVADRAAQALLRPAPDRGLEALRVAAALLQDGAARRWDVASLLPGFKRRGDAQPPARPGTVAEGLTALRGVVAAQPALSLTAPGEDAPPGLLLSALRSRLPGELAMRDVFPTPYDAPTEAAIKALLEARGPDALHALASRLSAEGLLAAWHGAFHEVLRAAPSWPREAFPTGAPVVEETPYGRIALGTFGPDRYEGEYAAIVDPGGDDLYLRARVGAAFGTEDRRVGLLLDLSGDDVYACRDVDLTLGAAVLGVAACVDLGQGDDRYEGGHATMGAALGGVALLHDDGGSDTYAAKSFAQGAAGYGLGVLLDESRQPAPVVPTDAETPDPVRFQAFDNDRLSAWVAAQAFSRSGGVALCVNERGNEIYEAGGVYLHAPLFADRYQSFSQGFSIGDRGADRAGGVALLVDGAGNDRYLGDVYDQGVGYWYAAGLLWDGAGNDLYECTQYGQGSGIHLAVGGLIDAAGSDAYLMHSGLGQGGSHDYAASVLMDRGGNDRWDGNTSCNGCALTNSVGLFFERGGDDTYAARRDGGFNAGRPARGFGSLGVFLDLGGKDDYLGPPAPAGPRDEAAWRGSDVGVGLDLAAPVPVPGTAPGTSEPNQLTGKAEVPAVCRTEDPLSPAVFDELWALAVRWEVGDNRVIVPAARRRLVAYGAPVLPHLDAKMERDESGLELRAYVDVLQGLSAAGAAEAALDLVRRNLASPSERRRRVALHLVGELRLRALEADVVGLLAGADEPLQRRAAGVLALLGSRAGDAALRPWLADPDERRVIAALGALLSGPLEGAPDVYDALRPALAHPLISVRSRLATLLAERREALGARVRADLARAEPPAPDAPGDPVERARRTLLDAAARGPITPDGPSLEGVARLLGHDDWGVRADAARVLARWAALTGPGGELAPRAREALAARLALETDPFVRRAAEGLSRDP